MLGIAIQVFGFILLIAGLGFALFNRLDRIIVLLEKITREDDG